MSTAAKLAEQIKSNVVELDAGRISFDEFTERQKAAWGLAIRGELCVMGSACDRRVMAVKRELAK